MNPNTATEYRNLPLNVLSESTTNPRHIFEDAALKELAESIRSQGVLSPLLVRPLTEQSFEIVAGARRYRAAQMAEAATVPVRIVNLTDAEALEAQLIENLQRRDVHPMEEAQGFRALLNLEEPKYCIEQIAARTGKTPAYCRCSIAIDRACAGRGRSVLCRGDRRRPRAACWRNCSPHNRNRHSPIASARSGAEPEPRPNASCSPFGTLQQWIEHNVLFLLKQAPFNKRDAQLVPAAGSCVDCPKRTGHNKLLFADVSGNRTLAPIQLLRRQAGRARTKADRRQAGACPDQHRIQQQPEGSKTIPRNKYVEIRQDKPDTPEKAKWPEFKTCKYTTEAIVSDGIDKGELRKVCTEPTCPVHHPKKQPAEGRCQLQSGAGEAPPRRGTGERNRNPRPAIHRRRRSRSTDEARSSLHCRTDAPVA